MVKALLILFSSVTDSFSCKNTTFSDGFKSLTDCSNLMKFTKYAYFIMKTLNTKLILNNYNNKADLKYL